MRQQQSQFKIKEAELMLQKALNIGLINTLEGFYYACDATEDYKATFVEGNVQNLTGYNAEQFLSQQIHLGALIHPEQKQRIDELVQKAIDKKNAYILEYNLVKADGSIKKVYEKGYPIFDEYEELSHLIGFVIDYETARKLNLIAL
jgi:PAS domain S-box-containing protein